MTDKLTPVGFAGLETLVSDVARDVYEALADPCARGAESALASQRAPTVDAAAPRVGRGARMIPAPVWVVGGVVALVWVCSNFGSRSSAPPRMPLAVTEASASQATTEVPATAPTGVTPAREVYSYVDKDGVLHFSSNPNDPRFKSATRSGKNGGEPLKLAAADPFREYIRSAAKKYTLPEALLLAVIAVESDFDPQALSEKGEIGLMQLMPLTAKDMFVADAWNPAQNIEGGARYLRILANEYNGDMVKTLAAYDAGREAVAKAGGRVPPEAQEYVRKVVALYHAFKGNQRSSPAVATNRVTPTSDAASNDASAGRAQTKPPIGSGRSLSSNEVRYCVFESARIEYMKPLASDNDRIGAFNRYVEDYNSRCASFRYRRGTLEAIRKEAAERASSLETEARLRFY